MGSAADLIYYYDLPDGSTLTIQQTVNGYDSRHSLRYSGACPGTIEIVCTDDSDLSVETWQNCTGSTQRVYWIQSGYSSGSGTFTLAWSVVANSCPTCSDGIQNGTETGVDCGGTCPACPAAAGDDCANLIDLASLVSPVSGTTVGAANDFSFCSMGSAPDLIAYYDVPDGFTITIQQTVNGYDSRHSLRYSGACPGTIEIVCTDDSDLSVETWQNCTGSTQRVYWIQSGYSSGSGTFTLAWSVVADPCPTCSDGIQNGTETGVDCGGTCPACPPTCSDGIQNQDETGIDCGGLTCPACPTIGACGNLTTNDFCSDPGILTQGTGNWNNTTTGNFTSDLPANINSLFCGSIENNSWYQFTAIATTETFVFSGVGGTSCGSGIQVEIYDVTTDANGCCTNFTSVSNCFNPASQTGGTVTATGLTIGNDYYMMIDGNAGAGCDFTVAGWDVSLPVELLSFEGYNYKSGNKLLWKTASEINNDYFIVQKSTDTKIYTNLGIVDGNGNSNSINEYEFIDGSSSDEVTYYRLKQIDFDGKYKYSKIVVLKSSKGNQDINIYPNPSKENFSFDISISHNEVYTISYTNITGATHREQISTSEGTNTYQVNDFKNLATGIYFVQILNENNELIKSQKIVKE